MSVRTPRNQETKRSRGLRCPACGCGHLRVVYTRPGWGERVIRRRECRHCARRFTTTEAALQTAFVAYNGPKRRCTYGETSD